jgi:hypothetical protein
MRRLLILAAALACGACAEAATAPIPEHLRRQLPPFAPSPLEPMPPRIPPDSLVRGIVRGGS